MLGALFRSRDFADNQTELVVLVSAYLVEPTAATAFSAPTDGFIAPTDPETLLMGRLNATYKTKDDKPVRPRPRARRLCRALGDPKMNTRLFASRRRHRLSNSGCREVAVGTNGGGNRRGWQGQSSHRRGTQLPRIESPVRRRNRRHDHDDAVKFDVFLADYRLHGNGSLGISVPDGAPASAAITYFAERAAATGISRDKILVSTHDVANSDFRSMSATCLYAHADNCGDDWSENLS